MAKKTASKKVHTITSATELAALADPLRYRIFGVLTETATSPRALADVFGTKPTQLYHHFRVLEDAGLIHVVETKQKRGAVERFYRAIAEQIAIDPGVIGGRAVSRSSAYASILRASMDELIALEERSRRKKNIPGVLVKRSVVHLSEDRLERLRHALEAWLGACEASSVPDGEGEDYAITVAFYPQPTDI